MELIIANYEGQELGSLKINRSLDLDIGQTNDFVLTVSLQEWSALGYGSNCRVYVPGTEYGGVATNPTVVEGTDQITIAGDTWRGMMAKKIIQPPKGEDYRTVSGDAHGILRELLSDAFGDMFTVPDVASGIEISSYSFDRYTDMLTGLKKMLAAEGARLNISYDQGVAGGTGHVVVSAVPIVDYSEELEYSQDTGIHFTAKEVNNGINHLICLGQGDLKDRQVIHLYVQEDGSIGETPYYIGVDEREAIYDYGNVESLDDLRKKGVERLESLKDYQSFEIDLDDIVAEVGDIVGGREYSTGIFVRQEITNKIVRMNNDEVSIDYKTGGVIKMSPAVGGGNLLSEKKEEFAQAAKDSKEALGQVEKIRGDFSDLTADYSQFKKATVQDLSAAQANIGALETDTAEISKLLAGNITADNIKAKSITAKLLAADAIKSTNYKVGSAGSFLNLADGSFDSPNLKWTPSGKVTAKDVTIEGGTIKLTDDEYSARITIQRGKNDVSGYKADVFSNAMQFAYNDVTPGEARLAMFGTDGMSLDFGPFGSLYATQDGITTSLPLTVGGKNIVNAITSLSNEKANVCDKTFNTLADFVTYLSSNPGRSAHGRFKDGSGWTPEATWWRFWAVLQNGKGGSYDVSGNVLLFASTGRIYHGTISGKTTFAVKWRQISGDQIQLYNSGGITNPAAQHLYLKASGEANYVVHLGVRDNLWALDPDVDGMLDLGTPKHRWGSLHAKNGTIVTSDRNAKNNIAPLDAVYEQVFAELKPRSYRLNGGDRTHLGFVAQDIEQILLDNGLTSMDWAALCKDVDDSGQCTYGLRYSEIIALNTYMIQKLYMQINDLMEVKNGRD